MNKVVKLRKVNFTFILVAVGYLSLILTAGQAFAYSDVSGLSSLWSGTSGWMKLSNGGTATFTLDNSFISPIVASVATITPIVFGGCVLVILLTGIMGVITRSLYTMLLTIICGILGILGVILIQGIVTSLFGG